jgi:hypothetical protein
MNKDFDHNNFSEEFDSDFDISKILNIFLRNKILISSFSIVFFILSCLYSLTKKRIWEGQFQIVVREDKNLINQSFISNDSLLSQALNVEGFKSSNLKTQVGILESSSVLMPVFEFFKIEKEKLENKSKELTFTSWKNNLGVQLKKNTSILNISFRDNNKALINSVLDKIIFTYQEYSGKSKKRSFELSNNYLDEQINLYKKESLSSMKILQDYAIDQDLTFIDYGLKVKQDKDLSLQESPFNEGYFFGDSLSIEKARVSALNEIKNIESKIKKLESLETDSDQISYFNLTTNPIVDLEQDLIQTLNDLNLRLIESESIYKENDLEVIKLKQKRNSLIRLLKQKSISFLKAQKFEAEAILEATKRPKGVLLKYKELARKANADYITLIQLENQKRILSLQQAKLEDPWELITKPTIKASPVAPRRKVIAGFGTIFGLIFGIATAVFKERRKGLIYEADTLESILKTKIIDNIDLKNPDSNLLINALFEQKKDNSFKFIYSNHLANTNPELLKNIFENKKYNSSIVTDLTDVKEDEILILVISIPEITLNELLKIKNQIEILKKSLFGIVIIKG